MGLGPPVCDRCIVIAELRNDIWSCPVCHSIRLSGHLWEYTDEYQQRFENNSKLVKFTKGQG